VEVQVPQETKIFNCRCKIFTLLLNGVPRHTKRGHYVKNISKVKIKGLRRGGNGGK